MVYRFKNKISKFQVELIVNYLASFIGLNLIRLNIWLQLYKCLYILRSNACLHNTKINEKLIRLI